MAAQQPPRFARWIDVRNQRLPDAQYTLDSLGFHRDTEACLRWFTEHQSGTGNHGNKDIGPDGTHPSDAGRQKVAELLQKFFTNDPLAKGWYLGR